MDELRFHDDFSQDLGLIHVLGNSELLLFQQNSSVEIQDVFSQKISDHLNDKLSIALFVFYASRSGYPLTEQLITRSDYWLEKLYIGILGKKFTKKDTQNYLNFYGNNISNGEKKDIKRIYRSEDRLRKKTYDLYSSYDILAVGLHKKGQKLDILNTSINKNETMHEYFNGALKHEREVAIL